MPASRLWRGACVRTAAAFVAVVFGLVSQALAAQAPAAVTAKFGRGAATLTRLWTVDGLRLPVIVEFALPADKRSAKSGPDDDAALTAAIHAAQDAILQRLLGAGARAALAPNSLQSVRRMAFSPLFAMSATAAEVERLALDPAVLRIHSDTLSYPQLVQTVPLVGMPAAYASGATGDGQLIAVLDSGARASHEFLAGKVAAEACFSRADASAGIVSACPGGDVSATGTGSADDCDPADAFGCGHGTHVAGIAAGFNTNAQAGEPQNGVARAARLFPVNVMSRALPGSAACKAGCLVSFASSQILGLEAVYARREKLSVAAVALGLAERTAATDCALDPRAGIIARLRAAGIATVVPAGNDGADAVVPAPGCIAPAITVAASTKKDERAFFSNWGPQVDLVAPGVEVLSSAVAGDGDSGYAALTGTSMAVPHVAGAIAALRTVRPEASVGQIEDALAASGVPIASAGITKPRIRLDRALVDIARPQVAPVNDNFADAIEIFPPSGSVEGTNIDASFETGEPQHASNSGTTRSVWWKYTPTTTGIVIVDTAGSAFDTVLAVYTGAAVTTLSEIASNDDFAGTSQSRVAFTATAGITYRIAVAGFDASTVGAIRLSVGSRPANDDFANRIALSVGGLPTGGNNQVATLELGEPSHAGTAPTRSVWWTLTAPSTGNFAVRVIGNGGGLQTVLAVYTGAAINGLTPVAAGGVDPENPGGKKAVFAATEGVTYAIAVDSVVANTGGDLAISAEAIRPVNDNFASRVAITDVGTVNGSSLNATAETGEYTHLGTSDPVRSVWWSFTPAATARYTLETVGSDFDTVLAVYTGTAVDTLEPVEFNDDIDGSNNRSRVTFNAVAGTSYAIVVAGSAGATGAVTLTLNGVPPDNDDFFNRVAIASPIPPAGVTVSGNTAFATAELDETDHAGASNPVRSVWWSVAPDTSGPYTLETTGSDFDTVLAVYIGTDVDSLVETASNDDIGGGDTRSRVTFDAVAGTTYVIAVAGKAGATGAVTLTARGVPPANDNFANRTLIADFGTVVGRNTYSTAETGEPGHAGSPNTRTSVWWRFTSRATGPLRISTAGSDFNTVLAIYTGNAVNALTQVAANHDTESSLQAEVTFQATAGTSYAIAVAGLPDTAGSITLAVEGVPPANDDFAECIAIAAPGTVTGTNIFATSETGEPNHASASTPVRSVWWSFTPTDTRRVFVDTRGSGFDTTVAVYTGTAPNALSLVASNDDIGSGTVQSLAEFSPIANTRYQIAVSGKAGAMGPISMLVGLRPANDNFAGRITIASPGTVTGFNVNATEEGGEPNHAGAATPVRSVWWRFTPATSGTYSLDTIGSNFDTVLAVYTGSSYATFVNITSDDDSGGNLQARLAFQATGGTQYQIVVAGKTGAQGAVSLTLRGPPTNDNFANRITIAAPGTVNGTNVNASAETGELFARNTVWWSFTPSASGTIGIDTIGSDFNTVLTVYTGSAVNALTVVASNDDIEAGNRASRVYVEATAGTSYAIAVAGLNRAQGAVRLTVASIHRPANDNFVNRITIAAPGTVTGSNVAATIEPGEPAHFGNAGSRSSVWWRYTPSTSGFLKIDTNGSPFNRLVAVYTGTAVNALTEVVSRSDFSGRLGHEVIPVTAGVSYSIAVAGSGTGNVVGPITLTLANVVPPANDNFANRIAIAGMGSVNGTTVNATAEAGEPVHFNAVFRSSVWWRYTPSANAVIRVSTAGSGGRPVLAVYTGGAVNALTLVGRDSTTGDAHVTFRATAGVSYAIAVAARVQEENTVTLNLTAVTPPANDNFADRITIAGLGTVTGTTLNATTEAGEPAHAPGSDTPNSVWWRYTPSANAVIRIDTNAALAVYTGNAVNALTLAGTNIAVASQRATLRVTAGVSYAIAVSGGGGREGDVQLTLAAVTPPPNDNFADRIAIPALGSVTGTTVNATLEAGEPSHHPSFSATNSVWWRYTPSVNGTISIDTVGSNKSIAGQVLAVYTGNAVNGLTLVARTYENFGTFPPLDSRVTLRVTAGVSYAIAVTGGYDQGEFPVQVNLAAVAPPANDQFASRITIAAPGSVTGTTVNATLEAGEPVHIPGTSLSNTVWWRFTPPTNTTLSFHTTGSEGDTALAVYTGTAVNALTPVASNDSPGFGPAGVTFNAVAGTSYAIAVSGVEGFQGAVTLNLAVVAPTNDNFANRIAIAAPGTVSGNNVLATAETGEPNHAGNVTARTSVWWRFTPATTGPLTVQTFGSNFNTVLGVYTGAAVNGLTQVASNDDGGGGPLQSRLSFNAVAGTSYAIAVAGVGNATGAIALTVGPSPANDSFASRTTIAALGTVTGNNSLSTPEAGEPNHAGNATARTSIWWRFTPTVTGPLQVQTVGSSINTVLGVYTGNAVNGLTQIASNDDIGGGVLQSRVTFQATAGTSYAIAVAGVANATGAITLAVSGVAPANDNFANRVTIAGLGSVAGVNGYATAETGEPNHAGNATARNTVWWRFTPTVTGPLQVQTVGSSFNTVLGVYTGTAVNGVTQVASNDDIGGGNLQSRLTFNAVAGTSYAIAVAGVSNASGNIVLAVNSVAPANDNFANRVTIAAFGSVSGNNAYATAETGESNHAGNATARTSVWWRFTPTVTGPLTVQTAGSSFNTVLGVYTGNAVNALTQVASNDDIGGGNVQSRATFNAVAGTSYAIAVAGVSNASGNITLAVNSVAPANDSFANRVTIAAFGSVTGANAYATAEAGEPNHAGNATARTSVWWRFTPSVTGPLQVQTVDSSFNTVLGVYTGSAVNGLTPVASNDDIGGGNLQSRVTFNAVAGTSYAIAVAGVSNASGNIVLAVNSVAPANDNFANRVTIAAFGSVSGNNAYATAETGESNHAGNATARTSVWWRFTPTVTGPLTVQTAGSSFNTVLGVYTGNAVNALTQVASNDDIGGGNLQSRVTFNAVAGTSYAIAVVGVSNATGNITLAVNSVAPANDSFANRVTIAALGSVTGTNAYATAETGEPNHAGNATARTSVWWRFTPTVTGPLTVQTIGSSFNTVLGVYSGAAVNGLTQVASNDDIGGGNLQSRVTFQATAGVSYAIAVAGVSNATGNITLAVNSIAPANDSFANRVTIAALGSVTGANAYATPETAEPNHAGNATARTSVWWRFTPSVTGPLQLQTIGSSFNTVLGVYTGSAVNGLTHVASNDDIGGGNLQSRVTFNAVAGTSYAIAVAGVSNATGNITLVVNSVPPANDAFANRVTIAAFGSVTGNNAYATPETGEPNHAGNATARTSVWWRFTPTVTGPLTMQTVGSNVDTVLAVYTGSSFANFANVTFNDDIGGGNLQSRVTFQATAGVSYAIAVAGVSNTSGNITLAVNSVPPANDNFANRITISAPGTVAGSNAYSTAETNEPFHAGVAAARSSVWWRYTPAVSGPVLVDTMGSDFATVLAVYAGSAVNALTPVASNNDAHGGTNRSKASFNAVAGTSYAIAVSGETAATTGAISLRIGGGIAAPLPIIVSAVTPVARAALVNSTVTAFATVINAGPGVATSCFIAKPVGAPSVSFSYRTITNGQLGTPNTPVNMAPGAAQAFVMALSSSAALQSNLALIFDCVNTKPASSTAGLNTFLLTATNAPAPADLVSAAVTPSGDGILNVPVGGTGFASLAAQNIGTAATLQARLSASAIGAPAATLPLNMVMCQTNPSTGVCLVPPTGTTVNFTLGVNQVATFAAFLTYTGTNIPFDPANKRVFVHFLQGNTPVGSASVAVRTTAPDAAGATATGGKQAMAQ